MPTVLHKSKRQARNVIEPYKLHVLMTEGSVERKRQREREGDGNSRERENGSAESETRNDRWADAEVMV